MSAGPANTLFRPHARRCFAIVALGLTALLAADATARDVDTAETSFIRLEKDSSRRDVSLQAAIVRYGSSPDYPGVTVDLVSALHIADATYYADLNRRFRLYDSLLYELVTDSGRAVASGNRTSNGERGSGGSDAAGAITGMQMLMTDTFNLSFQLDEVDYGRDNFVHADLSQEELAAAMADRQESLYVYFWRIVYFALAESARDPLGIKSMRDVMAAADDSSQDPMKLVMAQELARNQAVDFLAGPNGSAIIEGRNQRAYDVLLQRLEEGDRRLGIFYGAAHMPDLEKRLIEGLGMQRKSITWVDAWDLR